MPRQAQAQPLGKYHALLTRLVRQMGEDPRVPSEILKHVSAAADGVQKLIVKAHAK